jgi:DNA-binding NarL/FixJ family response regulator
MPVLTGDRALAWMVEAEPRVVAVMMTAQDTADAVRGCFELGARDYILKSNTAEEIYRLLSEAWPEYERDVRDRVLS